MSAIQITRPAPDGCGDILSEEALAFLADLGRAFTPRVDALLEARVIRQRAIDAGEMPGFAAETAAIREADWRVVEAPPDLCDRRVEITGPTDRKMIINALNSGANVFMADCEDSLAPTWDNVIRGQANLRDAVDGRISLEVNGKYYSLGEKTATLIVRPRGWHLPEKHMLLDGRPMPAALVDFGLYLFHNADPLERRGTGPYFYLPKLESHTEARLWADVFRFAEARAVVGPGRIRVTVLIETILAAFEMDEILHELRDYAVGLNCGRWDYIFSFIRAFQRHPGFVLPDRSDVTMTTPFLRAYSQLVIRTCHRRGAYAMGGMAAQIPIRDNPDANELAIARVRADKEREVADGHDGTWVAHPGLVPVAKAVFDAHMAGPNQLGRARADVDVGAADLLQVPKGRITEDGVRANISVALQYIAAWLGGNGCVPINHLMEDAATAEISRAQLWQWTHHATGVLDEGRNITPALFLRLLVEEIDAIAGRVGKEAFETGHFRNAAGLLERITLDDEFVPFLTLFAYGELD
ncbi:MAG: malate synthase A [Gammaproteobacteria bacterium]|nr:malate synthase A [Gammaproteobacteria bacterium]